MRNPFLVAASTPDPMHHQDRLEAQQAFIRTAGWEEADIFPMPGDVSTRSYIRLVKEGGIKERQGAILMDAPPDTEKLPEYLVVAERLRAMGLSVPDVYAADTEGGFALIEDFGDHTFTKSLVGADDAAEDRLYLLAVSVLRRLHEAGVEGGRDLPGYDLDTLTEEVSRFLTWYVPAAIGREVTADEKAGFIAAWQQVLAPIAVRREVLVHRDFHVDNLMELEGRDGIEQCGLLDFQDALFGVPAYDLVSLVEDARRDVPERIRDTVLGAYTDGWSDKACSDLYRDMAVLGAQRHSKVLGIFVRMDSEAGKSQYLEHIPRVEGLLRRALLHPALAGVRDVMARLVPSLMLHGD